MAERRHADVLVIGAGATGAIASLVLGEAGLDVVCLEQGGWVQPDDHPHAAIAARARDQRGHAIGRG